MNRPAVFRRPVTSLSTFAQTVLRQAQHERLGIQFQFGVPLTLSLFRVYRQALNGAQLCMLGAGSVFAPDSEGIDKSAIGAAERATGGSKPAESDEAHQGGCEHRTSEPLQWAFDDSAG
jgi:hypothetical protein